MAILGTMDIYKHNSQSCSNEGISAEYDEVLIVDKFDMLAPKNAVVIIEDKIVNNTISRMRAIPANKEKSWTMFGGCFIYTSNGIVPHSGIAIKLHDRIE